MRKERWRRISRANLAPIQHHFKVGVLENGAHSEERQHKEQLRNYLEDEELLFQGAMERITLKEGKDVHLLRLNTVSKIWEAGEPLQRRERMRSFTELGYSG